ncbi:DUF5681 domain-containing protein [Methylobacterium sp. J-077]|uniref:DUF5681 domain-containing protein n=1 Tax=Methylobacterium sp. J-077 TaxID=2836656 RepID=UPI001FBA4381|nr:DUF5681 domain-containing protein [Methylobacterium sp. J-077]MCJ2122876.1 DUF5681 domain-containing protein [Methylobacterium sp. J-077]
MSDEPIESNDNVVAREDDLAPQTSCADGGGAGRARSTRAGGGRFSRGQSGNPRGRPRKQPEPFVAMMKRVLNETVQLNRDGKRVEMSCGEAVFRSMCHKAMSDPRIGKEVFKLVAVHESVVVAGETGADPAQSEAVYQNHYARMRRQILAERSPEGGDNSAASDNDNLGPGCDPEHTS